MSASQLTQEQVTAILRDRIGNLMLMLWQQEAYIKMLEEIIDKSETPAVKEKED